MRNTNSEERRFLAREWIEAVGRVARARADEDVAHIVPHDPQDEDEVIRARNLSYTRFMQARRWRHIATDYLRIARGVYTSLFRSAEPGEGYYISARRGDRHALLAGPYDTHREALELVPRVWHLADKTFPGEMSFSSVGTCATSRTRGPGRLNRLLESKS